MRDVALIWLGLIWPIVATLFVYAISVKKRPIVSKWKYWLSGIGGGFIATYFAAYVSNVVFNKFLFAGDSVVLSIFVLFLALTVGLPFIVAWFMSRKCS